MCVRKLRELLSGTENHKRIPEIIASNQEQLKTASDKIEVEVNRVRVIADRIAAEDLRTRRAFHKRNPQ